MELEMEMDEITGLKVDVYHNFHTGGWSVRSRETETYGRVIAHRDSICVENAEFVVSESQREKVLEKGVKNVHAVIRGVVSSETDIKQETTITYNPYKYTNFVDCTTEKGVKRASKVYLSENGVYAENVTYID